MRCRTRPTDRPLRRVATDTARPVSPRADVSVRPERDHDVVVLTGEFDLATAPRLSPVIHRLLTQGRNRILIDLDSVTFLDGFTIDMLLTAHRDVARAGGSLAITEHRLCQRLLACTGTTTFSR